MDLPLTITAIVTIINLHRFLNRLQFLPIHILLNYLHPLLLLDGIWKIVTMKQENFVNFLKNLEAGLFQLFLPIFSSSLMEISSPALPLDLTSKEKSKPVDGSISL